MKNRINAISLLLSFLAVLSHELIVHHHHEDLVLNLSVNYEHDDGYSKEKHQHHHSQDEKKSSKHNHLPFPPHNHISATHGFDYTRSTPIISKTQVRKIASFMVVRFFFIGFSKPPDLKINPFPELQFLISSLYYPDANALRGPPAIV